MIFFALYILILNIPFGYWRGNVKKFSLQWFLAVHLPIPFIIAARLLTEIGFELYTFLFSVTAYFIGQILGRRIFILREKLNLFQDLKLIYHCLAIKGSIVLPHWQLALNQTDLQ